MHASDATTAIQWVRNAIESRGNRIALISNAREDGICWEEAASIFLITTFARKSCLPDGEMMTMMSNSESDIVLEVECIEEAPGLKCPLCG